MANIIEILEKEEIARLGKKIPKFAPGDTVSVGVNVVEGTRSRVQLFEGVVIARRNRGLNSSFIVRKISSGEGVERTFQLHSPQIESIEVKGAAMLKELSYFIFVIYQVSQLVLKKDLRFVQAIVNLKIFLKEQLRQQKQLQQKLRQQKQLQQKLRQQKQLQQKLRQQKKNLLNKELKEYVKSPKLLGLFFNLFVSCY